jgi:hypothetical protein
MIKIITKIEDDDLLEYLFKRVMEFNRKKDSYGMGFMVGQSTIITKQHNRDFYERYSCNIYKVKSGIIARLSKIKE